jgi:two-component system, OmpR family, sensor kinase
VGGNLLDVDDPGVPAASSAREGRRPFGVRLRQFPWSLRTRIVAYVIGLLAVATILFVAVTTTVLGLRLDSRIGAELSQEVRELRRLAQGNDPRTGQSFLNERRIFDVYFDRNVPSRNEAFIAFVGGKVYDRSAPVVPYRLDLDPELVARWGSIDQVARGDVETPAGTVEYLAVPLTVGGEARAVFVAATFRDRLQDDYDATLLAAGAVGIGVLLIGSLLAWQLAGRVVNPVTRLTRTARSISETDLSRRIPVEGRDEVAQQAATFNDMLDRLERAFAEQRQFLDDAGHELRTPLTIVLGNLELLPDDPVERQETVDMLTDELERMSRIVHDLLLLAKREQPDFLELSTVDVAALTDELATKAAGLAEREWVVESRGRGLVVADRQRLTEAMLQLAENAAKHGGDGSIRIGSSVDAAGARLWVRDEGPGIPLADQERIFERFERGGNGARVAGSGLGLPIVQVIAEAHGGRVELESATGRGATFTIVIPVDQDQREEPA